MPKNFALRKTRSGKGLLPPNPKRWEDEHNALDLRHALELPLDRRLVHDDAFGLLDEVYVVPHSKLKGLAADLGGHFTGTRSSRWSGMCVPCEDGMTLVIYNDSHPPRRVRATLMEEFFHIWLEHKPTRLRLMANGEGKREFHKEIEEEAYGSGAAALVPYQALKSMLKDGKSVDYIADHFLVSSQLVDFRIRVAKLSKLKSG